MQLQTSSGNARGREGSEASVVEAAAAPPLPTTACSHLTALVFRALNEDPVELDDDDVEAKGFGVTSTREERTPTAARTGLAGGAVALVDAVEDDEAVAGEAVVDVRTTQGIDLTRACEW